MKLIDLKALMDKARQSKNRAANVAYQSVHERVLRAMSIPGPKKGQPLTQKQIVVLIHDEIKDRRDSNEFMAPSQSAFADNQQIIKLLSRLLPG
jgi:hypothetical protein